MSLLSDIMSLVEQSGSFYSSTQHKSTYLLKENVQTLQIISICMSRYFIAHCPLHTVRVNGVSDEVRMRVVCRLRMKHGTDWASIGAVLGRSASSVKDRYRLMKDACNSGTVFKRSF